MAYNPYPITSLAETKTATDSGLVDIYGPDNSSLGNPALFSGVPAGQTVTKINLGRNAIVIGVGGYMCPRPI